MTDPRTPACDLVHRIASRAGVDPIRAAETFLICTEPLARSLWPGVAWRFSRLTADGSPVEFVFSSAAGGLRYTVEVGGPEMPEHDRIGAACALLGRLDHKEPPLALLHEWEQMQASEPLRWGCWLGIRQRADDVEAKLYVEVPRGAGAPYLVMIGYEAGTGRAESYFRKRPLAVGDVRLLSAGAVGALERLWGMPLATALGFFTPGYSVSGDQVAFFLRAGWIGGPAAARRRLLERESGCALGAYRDLTDGIPDGGLPDHGVLTLGFDSEGGEELRVGLSGVALASACAAGRG